MGCGGNEGSDGDPTADGGSPVDDQAQGGDRQELVNLLPGRDDGPLTLADAGLDEPEPMAGMGGGDDPGGEPAAGTGGVAPGPGWTFPEVLVGEWERMNLTLSDCDGKRVESDGGTAGVRIEADFRLYFVFNGALSLEAGVFEGEVWKPEPAGGAQGIHTIEIKVTDGDHLTGSYRDYFGCEEDLFGWEFTRSLAL